MSNEHRWHEMTYAEIGTTFRELENDRNEWRTLAETLHEVLRDNGVTFRCNCQDPKCREMRVYLDTVK